MSSQKLRKNAADVARVHGNEMHELRSFATNPTTVNLGFYELITPGMLSLRDMSEIVLAMRASKYSHRSK